MQLSVKLFLEANGKFILGPGRIELLHAVKELGSLRKAAEKEGMSYRWAWGRVKNAEQALGVELFQRGDGHSAGRPMVLTPDALAIIDWFESVEATLQKTLRDLESNLPPCLRKQGAAGERQNASGGQGSALDPAGG